MRVLLFHVQGGKEDDCMVCSDIAMLGPVMVKQRSMLKVNE